MLKTVSSALTEASNARSEKLERSVVLSIEVGGQKESIKLD